MKSFESGEQTINRTNEQSLRIQSGLINPHNHIGNLDNYSLDLKGCIEKVYYILLPFNIIQHNKCYYFII